MFDFDFRAWSRRRSTRAFAIAALVVGPIAAVPAIMATGATAAGTGSTVSAAASPAPSSDGTSATDSPTDNPTSATDAPSSAPSSAADTSGATLAAKSPAAAAACGIGSGAFSYTLDGPKGTATVTVTDPNCGGIEFSLVSYSLQTSGVSFPQTRADLTTATVKAADKTVTLAVTVPTCYAQVDLILGHDAPATLTTWYFSTNKTLLDAADFTKGSCVTTTTTPPPSTTTPPPSTTTPPPSTTTPPPSTTTPPPSTSTPPPSCPPGSTTPPPGSTAPPGTCEPPCAVTPAPASCFSTPVLGFSTSRPPVYYSGGPSLPYTGANVPLRTGLLSALGLLCGGAALILLAGRTAPAAGHRRR